MHYIYDSGTHAQSPTLSVCPNDSSCGLYKPGRDGVGWGGGGVIAVAQQGEGEKCKFSHEPVLVHPGYETAWAQFSSEPSVK